MALVSSVDVATFIVEEVLSIAFDRVCPIESTTFELVDIIVEEVAQIVTGELDDNPSMENPQDILDAIQDAIDRASRVNKEIWSWEAVLDLLATSIALLDSPHHLAIIRWIEHGLAGTRFAEFDLQASVLDYACLFDDLVEDTPRVA